MLNSELFKDSKDLEIAKLKLVIKSFKKYDQKRNKLIFDLNKEIKELKTRIEYLEGDESVNSLKRKVENQKKVIRELNTKLHFASLEIYKH
jgi:predicted 2-oxoglutarate/Fe(II)-dependent dioxygenase YbiX